MRKSVPTFQIERKITLSNEKVSLGIGRTSFLDQYPHMKTILEDYNERDNRSNRFDESGKIMNLDFEHFNSDSKIKKGKN